MIVPVLLLGSGAVDAAFYAWLVLAALILLADKIICGDRARMGNLFVSLCHARLPKARRFMSAMGH